MICDTTFKLLKNLTLISLILINNCSFKYVTGSDQVLDVAYPIVLTAGSNRNGNNNEPDSYFGYTVSLAPGKVGQAKTSEDPLGWVFVGAPKGTASKDMYSSYTKEPGVIWRCSLGRTSDKGDTCQKMNIDPTPKIEKEKEVRPKGSPLHESHNGSWIGVAMEINLGHFLTCGQRWHRGNNKYYNGICYWFVDSNTAGKSYRSNDLSKLVDRSTYSQRLTPFFTPGPDKDRVFSFTDETNTTSFGHEWQISQAGMSIHLFQNGSSASSIPNLLIGAPGVREYSGAVVLYTNSKSPHPNLARPNRNERDPTFSEFVVGNRGRLPGTTTIEMESLSNEYFGYSVTSGNYLNKNELLYASGSPRSNLEGQVTIFSFPLYNEQINSTYKRQIDAKLEIRPPKNAFGSYFGSVLHTIDLDGDGLDEIFVGAPLYTFSSGSNKDSEESEKNNNAGGGNTFQGPGDHGCVFVYTFKDKTKELNNIRTQLVHTFVGSKTPLARFGSAISSLVFNLKNSDGAKESYIVIGAPYEMNLDTKEDSSSGAVYVYFYNPETNGFGAHTQRIAASSISKSLNGFGCSLSIPEDIDSNKTPDVAIGSYKSDNAVILRTRPKISLEGWITFFDSNDEVKINEIRRGEKGFVLRSCFRVTEKLGLTAGSLQIWIKIKFTDPTITFAPDSKSNSKNELNYVKSNINAHSAEGYCESARVISVHKDGIGMDDASDSKEDLQHTFHFVQEVWYNDTLNSDVEVLDYPVNVSGDATRRREKFKEFKERNPSPEKIKVTQDFGLTDCKYKVCQPLISMSWSFFNEKNQMVKSFNLGQSKEIKLILVIANYNETAPRPTLTIDWSFMDIKESSSSARWLHRSCTNNSSPTLRAFGCPLGLHIKAGRNVTIEIQLTMDDIFLSKPDDFHFRIKAEVSFDDDHIEKFESSSSLLVMVPPTRIYLSGSRQNDSLSNPAPYITNPTRDGSIQNVVKQEQFNLYSPVRQTFNIEVNGAFVKHLSAHFKVPLVGIAVDKGKQTQLVLVQYPHTSGISCESAVSSKFWLHSIRPISTSGDVTVTGIYRGAHQNLILEEDSMPQLMKRRRRRAVSGKGDPDISGEIAIDKKRMSTTTKSTKQVRMVIPEEAFVLSCNESEMNCIEIHCTGENIRAGSQIHITFELYLVKDEIDKILQETGKESLYIESIGLANIFDGNLTYHKSTDVAQTVVTKTSVKEVPLWVYIVAVLSSILLLALIAFGLYKCGFFKREQREQLDRMKAEHHRKSMIATGRASIVQAAISTGDGGVSLEELVEAEHHNEDRETEQPSQKDDKLTTFH